VHMRQAELFVREAVRRTTTRTERDRGGREEDTEKVQCGNEHRRTAPGLPGQPNEHPHTGSQTSSVRGSAENTGRIDDTSGREQPERDQGEPHAASSVRHGNVHFSNWLAKCAGGVAHRLAWNRALSNGSRRASIRVACRCS